MMTLEKQNDRRGGFGSGQWLAGESMTMKTETPRTDELSNIVQNQNWGFRDMQILAGQLERELNNALADKKRLDCGYFPSPVPTYWLRSSAMLCRLFD